MAWYSPFNSDIDWAHSKLNNVEALKLRWVYVKGSSTLKEIYVKNTAAAKDAEKVINETLHFLNEFNTGTPDCCNTDNAYCIISKYAALLLDCEHYLRNISRSPVVCDVNSNWANRIRICAAPMIFDDFLRYYRMYENTDTLDRYTVALTAAYTIFEDADAIDLDYAKDLLRDIGQRGTEIYHSKNKDSYSSPFARWLSRMYDGFDIYGRSSEYFFASNFANKMLSEIIDEDKFANIMDFIKSKVNVSIPEIHELYTTISAYKDMKNASDFDKKQFADTTAAAFRPETSKTDAKNVVIIMMNSLNCNDPEFKSMVNESIDCEREESVISESSLEDDLAIFEAMFLQDMEGYSATEAYKPKPAEYEDEDDEDDDPDKEDDDKNKSSNPDNDKDDIPMHGTAKLSGASNLGIARSAIGNKVRSKIYPLYATYKREQGKVDAQVSKILANAGKTLVGLDSDTMQRRVLGANQFSILKTLKSLITTYAVFSVSKIGGLILLITRMALRKGATKRERKRILTELENEIEIVEEKINDARGTEDREAKYALMRTKQNLETAVKKIKYAKTHYMTEGGLADSHKAISDIRGGGV